MGGAPRMQRGRLVLLYTVLAFICFGSSNTQSVNQPINVVYTQEGESVTFDCKITVSFSVYVVYWYRQLSSGEMTHLIHLRSDNKNTAEGRYSMVFQKSDVKFTISNMMHRDSGVYFCAVAECCHSEGSDGKSFPKTLRAEHKPGSCSRSVKQPTGQEEGRQKAWWI
uniref:Ig-like domain-containing protein n=1 Tax=Equus asinus TaxID=9793 RepID=A0A9L0J5C8_EQUAS